MERLGFAVVAAVMAFAVAGCDLLTFGIGPPGPSPYPTLPASLPSDMDVAIEAGRPFAAELSKTPPTLFTAFAVDLAELCTDAGPGMCDRRTGPGWGVVFEITLPDDQQGQVLVVLDADATLLYTEQ